VTTLGHAAALYLPWCPCKLCRRRKWRRAGRAAAVILGALLIALGLWAAVLGGLAVAIDAATSSTGSPFAVPAFYGGIGAVAAGLGVLVGPAAHRRIRRSRRR